MFRHTSLGGTFHTHHQHPSDYTLRFCHLGLYAISIVTAFRIWWQNWAECSDLEAGVTNVCPVSGDVGSPGRDKNLSWALLAVHVFSTPVERSFFSGGAQHILINSFTMADLTYSTRRLSQPAVFDWQNQRASWRLKITSLGALGVIRWLGDRFFRFTVEPPFSLHRKKKGKCTVK